MPEESQVESGEHQDNANIRYQPFPESVSEEREIYTGYNGCHRHHVEHPSYPSTHFSKTSFHDGLYRPGRRFLILEMILLRTLAFVVTLCYAIIYA